MVKQATGLSRSTIKRGLDELEEKNDAAPKGRVRRFGAGRKKAEEKDPELVKDLKAHLDSDTRGDPESPLLWTSKSLRKLSDALKRQGHDVSPHVVKRLLKELGYSLQGTRKTKDGIDHPDRDAQFNHINDERQRFHKQGQPVISVDTKKKELVGNFANGGQEWRPKGEPIQVKVHDFPDPEKGKAVPYGVYDVHRNEGWVNVGTSADTAEFAVQSIRRWWEEMGRTAYPKATDLLITADCGGSNGYRVRLWKLALQNFADETGLTLSVVHFPPGTSKWNSIEHRMFSHITTNWRGRTLTSHEVVVKLIANTSTRKGLQVRSELDSSTYQKGVKVSKKEMQSIQLEKSAFHGEWNYTIFPRHNKSVIS